MSQGAPVPGWYADPSGAPGLRWWDGAQWTAHTQPGAPTPPPAPQPPAQFQPQAPAQFQPPPQAQPPAQFQPQAPLPQQGQFPQQAAPATPQPGPGINYVKPQAAPPAPVPPQPGLPAQPGLPPQPGWQGAPGWGPGGPGFPPAPVHVGGAGTPDQVQQQVQQRAGVAPTGPGGGSIFTEPVLVVNQKAQFIEITNQYAIFDQNGRQLGSVVEVGQSALKKAARVLSSLDQYMTHRLEVRDMAGNVQLVLTRPAKFIKSKVIVARPDGSEVGQIVQQNAIGKIRFGLMVGGQQIGMIKAENWRAWNFTI